MSTRDVGLAVPDERVAPLSAGPSDAFVHVRAIEGSWVVDGTPKWSGGTAVDHEHGPDGVGASWQCIEGTVRVTTDRLGFFPLYYFATATELCLSPSLVTLLERGAPRDLDHDAIGVFLRTGWFIGDDTAFAAIRTVPRSRRFEWSRGRLRVEPPEPLADEQAIGRDEAVNGYIERFRAAIARRLPPDGDGFVMPLSGGADSRHILLELVRQGRPPVGVVTARQQAWSRDVTVATELAERLGIPHTVLDGAMDAGWGQELRKNMLTNFCADEHVWYLPVADHLLARTRVTYDGIGGDVLSAQVDLNQAMITGMRAGRVDEILATVLAENHREDVLRHAVRPEFYARIPESTARDRLAEMIRHHLDRPNPWGAVQLATYDRREVTLTPHSMLASLQVHSPFLDRDVVDFLMSLSPDLLLGTRFHIDTLAAAYPDFADVAYARFLPNPRPFASTASKLRRLPAHLALHRRVHTGSPRSTMLRTLPPIVRHPTIPGSLGTFNRRGTWLRQIELLASGALPLR